MRTMLPRELPTGIRLMLQEEWADVHADGGGANTFECEEFLRKRKI
jgi:hypothetical protein